MHTSDYLRYLGRKQNCNPLAHQQRVGDVVTTSQVENEPCCGILD